MTTPPKSCGVLEPDDVETMRQAYQRLVAHGRRAHADVDPDRLAQLVLTNYTYAPADVESLSRRCLAELDWRGRRRTEPSGRKSVPGHRSDDGGSEENAKMEDAR